MTLVWHASSVQPAPSPRRGQLPWIGWGLVAAWSLAGFAVGLYSALNVTLDGQVGGVSHFGLQTRAGVDLLLFLVWFMSFNLGFAGLVVGVVCTARRATGRIWRSIALATLVVVGGIAEVWGLTGGGSDDVSTPRYVGDVQLHSVVTCVVAVVVVAGTAALLGLPRQAYRWN
jgi:hypothetical protein